MPLENEQETKTEPKAVEFEITHCQHNVGGITDYNIGITVRDCHVDIGTGCYNHTAGHYVRTSIFDLQPSDIKALGEAIIKEALKIEMEAETPA